ncbi:hypothetical protein [Streptomyces cyaneofuscatus]|uniref:hypothetical protein n=2 Tax=Streptomyces cyaneofuscatus TaxID=66883 RepID=UPI0036DE9D5B
MIVMIQFASEASQAADGSASGIVILVVIWLLLSRSNKAARTDRARRKREVEVFVRSRPEDAELFREVVDELDVREIRGKRW